jgi:MerR family copper efflux transcriptional regulator
MLTIGHVARQVGVQPSTIRYYEAQGILKPAARQPNGYRIYNIGAVNLLLFVKRAQALGITLKEIKPLLDLATRGQPPCKHVKELAHHHLRDINDQIRELQSLRNELRTLMRRKAGRPHGNKVCPLIQGSEKPNV